MTIVDRKNVGIFKKSESYRPFVYPWAVELEKQHRIDMHWHEGQVDLQDDLRQYHAEGGMATQNVSHEQNKAILNKLLLLFTEMDSAVGEGYTKLLPHIGNNEIRTLMMTFAAREIAHQRGYALAAETFGYTNSQWGEFREYKEMMDKLDLFSEGMVGDLSWPINFAKFLTTILLGEGIALFGAFACLLNLKRYGLMMGFNVVNEWSLNDESEHVKGNILIVKDIREKNLSEDERKELDIFTRMMVEKYVEAEHQFLDLVFEMSPQEGMTKEDAKEYISYLGRLRLAELGLEGFDTIGESVLPWMDYILSGSKHSNFFEQRVTDYSHTGLQGDVDYSAYQKMLKDKV